MYQINFQLIFLGGLTPNPDFPVDITLSSTEFVSLHYPNLNQFGPELPGQFCQSVTKISDVICDVNQSLVCFLRGDKKTLLLGENGVWTNKDVFLSPLKKQNKNKEVTNHSYWAKMVFGPIRMFSFPPSKKQKQRSDECLSQITSLIFVTYLLTELAYQFQLGAIALFN